MRFMQIDAFSATPFGGNPAAVVWMESFEKDEVLASIAAENNLSETAFLVRKGPGHYDLRWFTPTVEVELCGHATLAAGCAVLRFDEPALDSVTFKTLSGALVVRKVGDEFEMTLPSIPPNAVSEPPPQIAEALGGPVVGLWSVRKVHHADYWLALYPSIDDIDRLQPDIRTLGAHSCNVVCTAPGPGRDGPDFVSRFFAPASGVDEDPVTGSAHCTLAPFWSARLGRSVLRAEQRSRRGGELVCEMRGDYVALRGPAVRVIEGQLHL